METPSQTPRSHADDAPALSVENIAVVYRNGHRALRNASFHLKAGVIAALVGVNGAGKSTLFKAIMGLLPLTEGRIEIFSAPVAHALKRNLIAYVPQAEEVDWNFPVLVEDVVMMGRYGHMGFLRRPKARDRDAVTEALGRVDMLAFRDRQIGELSGGQRKRVFLARALAQEAKIILLDEPFAGVDVQTEDRIIALLRDLRDEGRVILIATHNLGTVPEYCDQTVMVKGTILAHGPTEAVFTPDNLQEVFGGVLRHFTISATTLHTDGDERNVTILTDDERPFVQYGNQVQTIVSQPPNPPDSNPPDDAPHPTSDREQAR